MKRTILKITGWAVGITALPFAVLVVHILMVTPKQKGPQIQLSRIDFKQDIDSAGAAKIRRTVAGFEGIKSTYFNVQDNILVYTYDAGRQNSGNVYNMLMAQGPYKAERYIVSAEAAKSGCPVMDKNSFSYRFSSGIARLFR